MSIPSIPEVTTDDVLVTMAALHKRIEKWNEETDKIGEEYEAVCDLMARLGGFDSFEDMRLNPYGLVTARLGVDGFLDFVEGVFELSGHILCDGNGSMFNREWVVERAAKLRVVPEF